MRQYTLADMKRGRLKETYVYFKLLSYVFSAPVAYAAYRLGITANQVTTLGILLSFPAALFNLTGNYLGAILTFHLFFLCDAVDGVLARGTETKSCLGGYLDDLAHYVFHSIFFVTLAVNFYGTTYQKTAFYIIIFLITNLLLRAHHDLVHKAIAKSRIPDAQEQQDSDENSLSGKVREVILGSFEFPNVLVYITLLIWWVDYLSWYILYATTMTICYYVYIIAKTVRRELSMTL